MNGADVRIALFAVVQFGATYRAHNAAPRKVVGTWCSFTTHKHDVVYCLRDLHQCPEPIFKLKSKKFFSPYDNK